MAFHIRDNETDQLVRHLALKSGTGLTEAIKAAVKNELRRIEQKRPLLERLEPILARTRGLRADDGRSHKQFWDEIGDDA